jgi:hypothetical protein
VGQAALLLATALSLVSGMLYFRRFYRCIDMSK